MAESFFEKLKKGMGIELTEEENLEKEREEKVEPEEEKEKVIIKEKPKKATTIKKPKKLELKTVNIETKEEEKEEEKKEEPEGSEEKEKKSEEKEKWFEGPVGELAIDVYQTEDELVIQSAIAGVNPEDLDISIENDFLTIKGTRENPAEEKEKNYFYQECYWGPFSKKIILPCEVDSSRVTATMKLGVLTIRMPKIERDKKRKIQVKTYF